MSERTIENGLVIEHVSLSNGWLYMTVFSPEVTKRARPGQFVFLRVNGGVVPYLRRAISICGLDREEGKLRLLYRVVGNGTRLLSHFIPGNNLNLMGPIGTPFPMLGKSKVSPLLVAGGMGVAPLIFLTDELNAAGMRPDFYWGYDGQLPVELVDRLRQSCNLTVINEAEQGMVTDALPESAEDFSALYICGPKAMMSTIQSWLGKAAIPAYASLEERLACGIGACSGCALPMCGLQGLIYKKVCVDGPVFPLREVIFDV